MSNLTSRDRELVALGAAMGSNCVPCVEYHIAEARKASLVDSEIHAAIQHADKIRQVPARKTLQAALNMLPSAEANAGNVGTSQGCGCGPESDVGNDGTSNTAQPMDVMAVKMSEMMATCGNLAQSAGVQNSWENKPAVNPKTSEGCC
jgi:4-carboxymuconolactone decarboxylase